MRRGAVSPGTARVKSPGVHGMPSSPDGSSSIASTLQQTDSRPTSGRRADESIIQEEQDTDGGRGYAHGSRGRFETFGVQDGRWEEVEGLLAKLNSLGISISRLRRFPLLVVVQLSRTDGVHPTAGARELAILGGS